MHAFDKLFLPRVAFPHLEEGAAFEVCFADISYRFDFLGESSEQVLHETIEFDAVREANTRIVVDIVETAMLREL